VPLILICSHSPVMSNPSVWSNFRCIMASHSHFGICC